MKQMTTTRSRVKLSGVSFGARGCSSCTCDPCDCNPCTCGDDLLPSYPAWRVSGYVVTRGTIDTIDISDHIILSLAQPRQAGANDEWQEVLLVDAAATPAQVNVLLSQFEAELASLPAEVQTTIRQPRAVYQVPMHIHQEGQDLALHADFVRDQAVLIRETAAPVDAFIPWQHDGLMARRQVIELNEQ